MPFVSITICTRNRASLIRETLDVLESVLPRQGVDYELILVDNASTDDTPRVLTEYSRSKPFVKFHIEPRPSKSLALNRAAAAAKGEIFVWTDDDIHPEAGWLEGLIEPLVNNQYDIVTGKVTLAPHLVRSWMTPYLRQRYGEIPWADGGSFPIGANMAMTRAIFEQSEGYNPYLGPGGFGLGTHEETFIVDQLLTCGARVGYAARGKVVHHFQPARLRRQLLLEMGSIQGRSSAYIFHHWNHMILRLPWVREKKKHLELALWRLRHRPDVSPDSEGITERELWLVQQLAFANQYQIESRQPRHYVKRGMHRTAEY